MNTKRKKELRPLEKIALKSKPIDPMEFANYLEDQIMFCIKESGRVSAFKFRKQMVALKSRHETLIEIGMKFFKEKEENNDSQRA